MNTLADSIHQSRWWRLIFFSATVLWLAGCASHPQAKEQSVAIPARTPPPAAPTINAETPKPAATATPAADPKLFPPNEWKNLFDGQTLNGWKITDFAGHGEVRIEERKLLLGAGAALTGVTFTNPLPKIDFEVALEAMKVEGGDFFCGLTFPVGESWCSFIAGGWGGAVVGISSIDGQDASENETTKYMNFEKGRWYRIRIRVTPPKIEAWIDEEKLVEVVITDRKISMRFGEIEESKPFGLATYQTIAALRDIRLRKLEPTR